MNTDWQVAKNKNCMLDLEAAEIAIQFMFGWFMHPIYVNGDYPDVMKWKIGNKSKEQLYNESRLPVFTEEEKQFLRGMFKFHVLNYLKYSQFLNGLLSHF